MQALRTFPYINIRTFSDYILEGFDIYHTRLQSEKTERATLPVESNTRSSELTARETEILRLVAQGLTNKQIADRLNTSTGTMNNHIHHIFKKLEVSNRTQAATWAIRNEISDE